jgi:hypothetical protein
MITYLFLSDRYVLLSVGRPIWREDGSVFCMCRWPLPAQYFSGPSPLGLETVFYCLRFGISRFVASYDSQGHGGGIRPRLHHSRILLYPVGTDHAQKTQPLYCWTAQTTEKTRVTCQTASSLVRYQHWAWRGLHRKQSIIYCCVLDLVYIAVAWQRVDQIRYNNIKLISLYGVIIRLVVITYTATFSPEKSVVLQRITRRYILQGRIIHNNCCETLNSYIAKHSICFRLPVFATDSFFNLRVLQVKIWILSQQALLDSMRDV